MELVRSSLSIPSGLPCEKVRSAPAIVFSGPAQRSLTLWPARSPSRHATLYIESSDSFVASAAASIATGWSEPVPGRELHPLKSSAFHGALLRQLPRFVVPGVYSILSAAGPTPVACLVLGSMPISATPPTPPRLAVTTWPRALKSACTASGRVLGTERLPRLARS